MFVDSGCSAAPWRAALRFSGGERLGLFASEGSTANRPHPPRLRLEPSGKESGSVYPSGHPERIGDWWMIGG